MGGLGQNPWQKANEKEKKSNYGNLKLEKPKPFFWSFENHLNCLMHLSPGIKSKHLYLQLKPKTYITRVFFFLLNIQNSSNMYCISLFIEAHSSVSEGM